MSLLDITSTACCLEKLHHLLGPANLEISLVGVPSGFPKILFIAAPRLGDLIEPELMSSGFFLQMKVVWWAYKRSGSEIRVRALHLM